MFVDALYVLGVHPRLKLFFSIAINASEMYSQPLCSMIGRIPSGPAAAWGLKASTAFFALFGEKMSLLILCSAVVLLRRSCNVTLTCVSEILVLPLK